MMVEIQINLTLVDRMIVPKSLVGNCLGIIANIFMKTYSENILFTFKIMLL